MPVLGFDKRRGICSWEILWTTAVIFIWQYSKRNYFSSSSIVIITCLQDSLLLITMNWKMPGRAVFCFFHASFCSSLTFEKSHFSPHHGFSKPEEIKRRYRVGKGERWYKPTRFFCYRWWQKREKGRKGEGGEIRKSNHQYFFSENDP